MYSILDKKLLLDFGKRINNMFNPAYDVNKLLMDKKFLKNLSEIIVSIEIINLVHGKRPSNEFIKVFKGCIPEMESEKFLMHLATLVYLDKRSKLFRAVVRRPEWPHLFSDEIIMIAERVLKKEGHAIKKRQDSDSVKIKGGAKKARIISFEKKVKRSDGSEYIKQAKVEEKEKAYKKIFEKEAIRNLQEDLVEYLRQTYRPDRAKNVVAYIDYLLKTVDTKINVTKAASDLGISRKSLYEIRKSLKNDRALKRLIEAFRNNSN